MKRIFIVMVMVLLVFQVSVFANSQAEKEYQRAVRYHENSDYYAAVEHYGAAVTLDPSMAEAYFMRGMAYLNIDKKKSIPDFTKAIELDGQNPSYYLERGWAYNEIKQPENAVTDFKKVLTLLPGESEGYYGLGNAYNQLEQYDAAIENYTKAIQLEKDLNYYYYNRGIAYFSADQYEAALKDFDTTINLATEEEKADDYESVYRDALYQKALALDQLSRDAQAAAVYKEYLKHSRFDHQDYIDFATKRIQELS